LTLCFAAAAGVSLVLLAQRLRIPYIVLLLFGGVALGPEGLGVIDPSALGPMLGTVVSLAVAIILFEGGLTLDREGYRRAPSVIKRLLTIGPLITWLGTAAVAMALFDLTPGMALLASSLVIVTGPTVISPLLRRLNVTERVHHILYWEGVLVDVIGVFVAVLCYEWLTPDDTAGYALPIGRFALRLMVGAGIGALAGLTIAAALKRGAIPDEQTNLFVLAAALLTYGLADAVLHEAGILAVVVAGLVVGARKPRQLRAVKGFKLQLTEFGIALVFVLLAAKLELQRFADPRLLVLLAVVIVVLRPSVIWIAAWNQGLKTREKLFLSWIAPRGIVAAAMASLFAARLQEAGHAAAVWLETITYAVITVTVTVQGLTAPFVARLLRLERPDKRAWVLLGETPLVTALGRALRRAGVRAIEVPEDAREVDPTDPRFADAGSLLALHPTMLENVWAITHWRTTLRQEASYRWAARDPEVGWEEAGVIGAAGRAVWGGSLTVDDVAHALRTDAMSFDVVEIGDGDARRFGEDLRPLFWIEDGAAELVLDPLQPGPLHGEYAVVLRRQTGLAGLVAHVQVVADEEPTFDLALEQLIETATRLCPGLDADAVREDILERRRTMPVAVGAGMAIPHAYWDGIDHSICVLGVVPKGLAVDTPDGEPVRLIFLVISPAGRAAEHLEALATLGSLGQDRAFVDLLARQIAPARIASLIRERG